MSYMWHPCTPPGLATSLSSSCSLTLLPPYTLPLTTLVFEFRAEAFMSKTYNAQFIFHPICLATCVLLCEWGPKLI